MIKKLCLVLVFISLVGLLAFGIIGEQEEFDFLLFMPNINNIDPVNLSRDRTLYVMIVFDDTILNPSAMRTICTWEETPGKGNLQETKQPATAAEKDSQLPWWIIPLTLISIGIIAAIIFFASGRGGSSTMFFPAAAAVPVELSSEKIYVLTEEEIRHYAHELYQQRKGQNEDAIEDWHRSILGLTACYEAQGYRVLLYWEAQI